LIRHISSPDHIVLLSSASLEDSVTEVLESLIPESTPDEKQALHESIIGREKLRPTVLSNGVAFPRAESCSVNNVVCGVGISDVGIPYGDAIEVPVQTMFLSLYPEGGFKKFVPVLNNLVRFSQDPQKMASLRKMSSQREAFRAIRDEAFPSGIRELVHSHLFLPFTNFRNRVETMVRVRHD